MLRLTTKQIADLLEAPEWRIRRLFETAEISEPERFAGKRMIDGDRFLAIIELLSDRGLISNQPHELLIRKAVAAIAAGDGKAARHLLQMLSDATGAKLTLGADIEGEVQDA